MHIGIASYIDNYDKFDIFNYLLLFMTFITLHIYFSIFVLFSLCYNFRRVIHVGGSWMIFSVKDLDTGICLGHFSSAEKADEFCCALYDKGKKYDFLILKGEDGGFCRYIPASQLEFLPCPECGKPVRRRNLVGTLDYYGLPARRVCPACKERIMRRGYDGHPYDILADV